MALSLPSDVAEEPERGSAGTIDGRRFTVGKLPTDSLPAVWARAASNRARLDAAAIAWVCVENETIGAVLLRDPLRRQAPRTMRRLRAAGLTRLILTGDRVEPAREVATVLGLDDVYAQQSPADKVSAVRAERDRAVTAMVGDGVNDAAALAMAAVGWLPPAAGALLQEGIDVAVILNALRALRGDPAVRLELSDEALTRGVSRTFSSR